jgi:hypothetical protein
MMQAEEYEERAEHHRLLKEREPQSIRRHDLQILEGYYRSLAQSCAALARAEKTLRSHWWQVR